MEELIVQLKSAREEKKISLEDVSRQTKIQLRYLEALENNDFSLFAGEVYVKGALTNYAALVGLDVRDVLDLYNRLKGAPATEEAAQKVVREEKKPESAREARAVKRRKPRRKERQGPSLTAGVAVLVLALILAGVWFSQIYEWSDFRPGPAQPDNSDPGENGAGGDDQPEPEPEPGPIQQIAVLSASAGETVFSATGFEELEIVLAFTGPCWVQLFVDGTEPFYPRTFSAGERYSATADQTIRLRMGDPRTVRITVNGIDVTENRVLENPHNFQFNLE